MLRIAIVDDLSEDRQSLAGDVRSCFTLSDVKVAIQTFQDARSFRMANGQHPFHLFFLDICMDEMDGISLSKLLRREDPDVLIKNSQISPLYAESSHQISNIVDGRIITPRDGIGKANAFAFGEIAKDLTEGIF